MGSFAGKYIVDHTQLSPCSAFTVLHMPLHCAAQACLKAAGVLFVRAKHFKKDRHFVEGEEELADTGQIK